MGYVILFGWLIVLPFLAGGILQSKKYKISLSGQWIWGQFLLWAVFQVLAIPYIVTERSFGELVVLYAVLCLALGAAGVWGTVIRWIKEDKSCGRDVPLWTKSERVIMILLFVLWGLQMLVLVFGAVNDGDDAFYMAVAHVAENSDSMYLANVYAVGTIELNYRYALAPFPIWIAFLSRISGVHTLTIGHIILGMVLVTMSYGIYVQISKEIFGESRLKRLQMLLFVMFLHLWGNTSSHTAESFLLLRSRQGKALVAGIVFPAIMYLLIKIGHALEQKRTVLGKDYLLGASIILTGCLGSTMGGTLVILLWGSALFFLAIGYRKLRLLPAGALCCVPGLILAMMYLLN